MKKVAALLLTLAMMLSFSLSVYAKDPVISPSGKPVQEEGTTVVESPKTGDSDIALYGFGTAAVLFASGAVMIRKKAV